MYLSMRRMVKRDPVLVNVVIVGEARVLLHVLQTLSENYFNISYP